MPAVNNHLTITHAPDGRPIRMQPLAVELDASRRELAFPPKYGEHTAAVLAEAGYAEDAILRLQGEGIVAT
jgi:crotonobetainyl-CoA:carnitine CoA-transferase CaiB-like acyl-CoA transferase